MSSFYPSEFFDTSGIGGLIEHWREVQASHPAYQSQMFETPFVREEESSTGDDDGSEGSSISSSADDILRDEIVLSSAVSLIDGRPVGREMEIIAVRAPWSAILRALDTNPNFLYYALSDRQLEEIVAAAYHQMGFEVVLTPPKNDGGRDVVATEPRLGVRIFEEVKRYAPGHKVGVETLHKLHSVLGLYGNVSKGFVSTTSDFTSEVPKRFGQLMPHRLETRNGAQLRDFLRKSAQDGS